MATHFEIERLKFSANEKYDKIQKCKNQKKKQIANANFYHHLGNFFFFFYISCVHVLKRGRSDLWALKLD